jgi:uncharacterized damage-inducible protein DinB
MDDAKSLATLIERTVTGPAWHGSALAELLSAVTPAQAASHPIAGAHSIWELVLHIASWATIAEERLSAEPTDEPDDDTDWPRVPRPTAPAWDKALSHLTASHSSLAAAVRELETRALDRRVPGRKYTIRTMLHGVIEHGAYHGGQVALMTKVLSRRHSP